MRLTKVKKIIREGWSRPERVEGWVDSQLYREFADPSTRKEWKAVLRRAVGNGKGSPARTALDIGTGPGTIAQFWSELDYQTMGIDFSPRMLEAARQAARERNLTIHYTEGDAEDPPFPDRSFNLISSRFLLFTLPHPGYALRRWTQLLREGGVLVLIGHDHPQNPENRGHHQQKKRKWRMSEEYRQALQELPFKNHTSGELRVVMEAAGLNDICSLKMDGVIEARARLGERTPELGEFSSVPFVLVGRK